MSYVGDFRLGETFDVKFVTTAAATGAPTQLAGTPVISAYPGNSTTELTAGITLTVDFDSRTGLNNVRVVATSGNGYATATNYQLVITTGTVGGTSAVGYVIGQFSIENRSAIMSTTAANKTIDVASTGEVGLDFSNVLLATGIMSSLGAVDAGTAQAGSASGTFVLRSGASAIDDFYNGATVYIYAGVGAGQSRYISDYTGSTRTCVTNSFQTWSTTPDNTSQYIVFGTAGAAGGGSLTAADVWTYVTRTLTAATNITSTGGTIPITAARVDASVGAYQTGLTPLQPTVALRTLDVSAGGEAGLDWANIGAPTTTVNFSGTTISAVSGAVGNVTGSVGSVTGNVGGNVNGNVVGSVGSVNASVTVNGLTFTVPGFADVNVRRINSAQVQGTGTAIDQWRGV